MADNQDPLAALQQLLDDQKKQGGLADLPAVGADGVASSSSGEAPVAPADPPVSAGPTAEEIAALQKEKEAEDQLKIEEQLGRMNTELKDTPQYQARMTQKAANDSLNEQKQLEERSRRIFQLKRLDP